MNQHTRMCLLHVMHGCNSEGALQAALREGKEHRAAWVTGDDMTDSKVVQVWIEH